MPQASALGRLFILYINDIVNVDHDAKFNIYADDTSLFFSGACVRKLISKASTVVSQLESWTEIESLNINVKKAKSNYFSVSRNTQITRCFCEMALDKLNVLATQED